ncbi:MAG: TIGR03013 family XrtA/PEP-CTERM system glycosyltransferase [Thermodesulfobacteriota bacterium]
MIFISLSLAAFLFMRHDVTFAVMLGMFWPRFILICIITQLNLYFRDLYQFKTTESGVDLTNRLLQAIAGASITLAIIYFLWPKMLIGKWVFFTSVAFLLLLLVSWRLLYSLVIRKKLFTEPAVILGSGELAQAILHEINNRKDIPYRINLIVAAQHTEEIDDQWKKIPVRYGFDGISKLDEDEKIESIIVALDEKRGILPYKELLQCKLKGMKIIDGESMYERISGKLMVEKLNPSFLIFSDGFVKSNVSTAIKKSTDLLLASIMLVLFSPIMLLVALAIKLDSSGPVFFSQERVGKFGKLYSLHKFRSMRADAEDGTGPVWAAEDDPRITRVGRVIRRVRIDEFPQLWNVLKGEMSFVGPRPERLAFVEKLKKKIPYYNERLTVEPGITGWAQIKYPYGASEKDALEKLKYDLYYIKNRSLIMDFIIMFHTAKAVVLGRGAR